MKSIVYHADRLGRRNGPVHRVMGGAWRPLQAEYMVKHAEVLAHRSNSYNPTTAIEHVEAGIGKTIAYVVVEAANIVLRQRMHRTICTTFTRDLRNEIFGIGNRDGDGETIDPGNGDLVNRILAEHLADEGEIEFPYDPDFPIVIAMRTSFTAAASPRKADELLKRAKREKWPQPLMSQVEDYRRFVITDGFEAAKLPLLSEWVAMHGLIPTRDDKIDLIHFALDHEELYKIGKHYEIIKHEIARNNAAITEADILVVTHALFTMNGIEFGSLLNTKRSETHRTVSVVIDEAHLLPEQGNNALDSRVTMDHLEQVLKTIKLTKKKAELEKVLFDIVRKTGTTEYAYVNRHSLQFTFVEAITDLIESIEDKIVKNEIPTKVWENLSLLDQVVLGDLVETLKTMVAAITHCDGRSTAFSNAVKQAEVYNIIHHDSGRRIMSMLVKAESPETLVTPTWRGASTHAITHLAFVSGTLEDTYGTFTDFGLKVGIRSGDSRDTKHRHILDADFEFRVPDRSKAVAASRSPSRVILCDNLGIKPSVRNGDEFSPNPEHIDFIIRTLDKHVLSRPGTDTTLLLLSSYAALELFKTKMPATSRQVLFQSRELGASADVPNIQPGALVCGLNWQGVNYVRGGKTLIDRVVLGKLPFKPQGAKLITDINHVLRETIQGVMRGIRFDADRPEVWCMDHRLKVPLSGLTKLDGSLSEAIFRPFPGVPLHRFSDRDSLDISDPIVY